MSNTLHYDHYICSSTDNISMISEEFLRDGDMLAARMTGTLKIDGIDSEFETFMIAKLDSAGRMEWLKERAVWGPVGEVLK